jgi:hypothetical protein
MKFPRSLVFASVLMFVAGCASTDSRIHSHQQAFDSWPAEVQQRVREGKVDVGFTPEMVKISIGDPDRTSVRTTAQGTAEVWSYADRGPKFSFGLGLGTSRGSSAFGGGVTVGNDRWERDEVMRIIFEGGKVAAIERKK